MRVSEQEGLKAAESQSQGLAPAFTRFEGAVGRQRSPYSISTLWSLVERGLP